MWSSAMQCLITSYANDGHTRCNQVVKQYYTGPLDGLMGKQTRGAVMAFQADSGIEINGRLDTPTLNALGIPIP